MYQEIGKEAFPEKIQTNKRKDVKVNEKIEKSRQIKATQKYPSLETRQDTPDSGEEVKNPMVEKKTLIQIWTNLLDDSLASVVEAITDRESYFEGHNSEYLHILNVVKSKLVYAKDNLDTLDDLFEAIQIWKNYLVAQINSMNSCLSQINSGSWFKRDKKQSKMLEERIQSLENKRDTIEALLEQQQADEMAKALIPVEKWKQAKCEKSADFTTEEKSYEAVDMLQRKGGGVAWDSEKRIFKMNHVNLSYEYKKDGSSSGTSAIYLPAHTTIVLEGENTIDVSAGVNDGIQGEGDLTITGSGTLNIIGAGYTSKGIWTEGNLTIQGGGIRIFEGVDDENKQVGIHCKKLIIAGGEVKSSAKVDVFEDKIEVEDSAIIRGSYKPGASDEELVDMREDWQDLGNKVKTIKISVPRRSELSKEELPDSHVDDKEQFGLKSGEINKIQEIKKKIDEEGLTEERVKEAGKIILDRLISTRTADWKEVNEAIKEYQTSDVKGNIDEAEQRRNSARQAYEISKSKSIKADKKKTIRQAYEESTIRYWEAYLSEDAKRMRARIRKAKRMYYKSRKENANELAKLIGQIRQVGAGEKADRFVKNKQEYEPHKQVLDKVIHYYPTEWIDASDRKGSIAVTEIERGYYNSKTGEIGLKKEEEEEMTRVATHELGHRFEHVVPHLAEAEKMFFKRRTDACGGKRIRMPENEEAKEGNFIIDYIGKIYDEETSFEILSVGYEYAYNKPTELWKDKDYAAFVYGTLAVL